MIDEAKTSPACQLSNKEPTDHGALANAQGIRILQGQQYLMLTDPSVCYRVEAGYVSVYLVQIAACQPAGPRRYLFNCHEGSALYGGVVTHDSQTHALMAVAIEECQVQEIYLVDSNNEVPPLPAGLLDAMQTWCSQMTGRMLEAAPAQFSERIEPAVPFQFSQGQVFRPVTNGIGLLRLDSGGLRPLGLDFLDRTSAEEPLVLTGDFWFRVQSEQVAGNFIPVADTAGIDPVVMAGVAALTQIYIRFHLHFEALTQEAERCRFARLEILCGEERRQTVNLLRLDKRRNPRTFMPRESPLLGAMDVIGRYLGLEIVADTHLLARPSRDDQVDAITRASGTRTRHVRLLGTWWKDDVGHLLCFRKGTGAPVALVNEAYWLGMVRRYEVVDGETGERQIFTPEMADGLDEVAYAFLRPLPVSDKVSFADLGRFTYMPFLKDFRLMFLLSLISALLGIFMPIANFMMTDKVIPDANRDLMWDLALGLSAMSMGLFFFGLSTGLVSIRVKSQLTAHLQSAIMDRLLRLPLRFFRRYPSGDLLNRAMMISEISAGFSMTVVGAILGLFSTLMMLAMCFYYSAKLAFLALIAAVLTSIFSLTFSFLIRKKALGLEIKSGELFGFVVQMVNGVTKLQIAGADGRALNQWAQRYGEQMNESYAIAKLGQWSGLINMIIQTSSTIALYYLAGSMVAETAALQALNPLTPPLLTIGTFFAVQGAFGAVVGGIVSFFASFLTLHQQYAKRELVRPILEEPVEGGGGKVDPGRLDGLIEMNQITFRYHPDGPLILRDVSLKILPGEFVALVGPSGSGKSTILKLLLGFDFPESGKILFDKKDIADLDMLAVRRQVGVVLQDGKINAGTLYHAICGASQMSMDEAWEAAEAAGFAEDIRSFPMGMHTLLSEGATTLSGGQRQRLLIARALATKPRLVFFDEATSALDNRTQAIVTESLRQRRVTRVVVAHRLTTVMDADRIYVLEKGEVTEEGNFEELMAQQKLFYRMASRQLA